MVKIIQLMSTFESQIETDDTCFIKSKRLLQRRRHEDKMKDTHISIRITFDLFYCYIAQCLAMANLNSLSFLYYAENYILTHFTTQLLRRAE